MVKSRKKRQPIFETSTPTYIIISITVIAMTVIFLLVEYEDWPAWIQAVGSIAAIIVAFLISLYQSEQNRVQAELVEKERDTKEIQKIISILSISFKNYTSVIQALKHLKDEQKKQVALERINFGWVNFSEAIIYLRRIDWMYFPDGASLINISEYIDLQLAYIKVCENKSAKLHPTIPQNNLFNFEPRHAIALAVSQLFYEDEILQQDYINNFNVIEESYQKAINSLKYACGVYE